MEIKINCHTAETVYINHPNSSYAIFCFNSVGDLFVNSDWGFYGYAWRAYTDNFKEFLASSDANYIVNKFEINFRTTTNKKITSFNKNNLIVLVDEFIKVLQKQLKPPVVFVPTEH